MIYAIAIAVFSSIVLMSVIHIIDNFTMLLKLVFSKIKKFRFRARPGNAVNYLIMPTFSIKYFVNDLLYTFENSQIEKLIKREARVRLILAIIELAPKAFNISQEQINAWRIQYNNYTSSPEYAIAFAAAANQQNGIQFNRAIVNAGPSPKHKTIMPVGDINQVDPLKIAVEGEITKKISSIHATRAYAFQVLLLIREAICEDSVLAPYKSALRIGVKGSTAIYLLFKERLESATNVSKKIKYQLLDELKKSFDGGDVDTCIYINTAKLPSVLTKQFHQMLSVHLSKIVESILLRLTTHQSAPEYSRCVGTNTTKNITFKPNQARSSRITKANNDTRLFEYTSKPHSLSASSNSLDFELPNGDSASFELLRLKLPVYASWGDDFNANLKGESFDLTIPSINDHYNTHLDLIEESDSFTFNMESDDIKFFAPRPLSPVHTNPSV